MFSKPVYNNIKYPQPQYNHQSSITKLPSFSEVLTSIQLPTEFPLNKPIRSSSTQSSINSISPGPSPSNSVSGSSVSGSSVSGSQYYYGYNYNYSGRQSIMSVSTPISTTPHPMETVSPKTMLPTPPPTLKESKDSQRRRHICKTCSRCFTTSGHLARHNRIHTGERKHVCPWENCDARFARQDNCMQHYKTHTNGKKRKNNLSFKNKSI